MDSFADSIPAELDVGVPWTIVLTALTGYVLYRMVSIVPARTVALTEWLGNYYRTQHSGLTITTPFLERVKPVHVTFYRENGSPYTKIFKYIPINQFGFDLPPKSIFTKDNVKIEFDVKLHIQVVDPKLFAYEVADPGTFINAIAGNQFTQGDMSKQSARDILQNSSQLCEQLRQGMEAELSRIGVNIVTVLFEGIEIPEEISRVMKAKLTEESKHEAAMYVTRAELEREQERQRLEHLNETARQKHEHAIALAQCQHRNELALRNAEANAQEQRILTEARLALFNEADDFSDPEFRARFLLAMEQVQVQRDIFEKAGEGNKTIYMPYHDGVANGNLNLMALAGNMLGRADAK